MTDTTEEGIKEIILEAVANSFWATRPVEEEPEISLVRWQIMELDGKRYFVGYHEAGYEGRVSSAIVTFDAKAKKGITESGRVYQLIGKTGIDQDARWVLGPWLVLNGFKWEDIQWRMV